MASAATLAVFGGFAGGAMAVDCDVILSALDFGRIESRASETVAGEVRVACDGPALFEIALSDGFGSFRMRKMRGPDGRELDYNLYIDPARTQVWGDGSSAGAVRLVGRTDGRRLVSIPVFGWIPPGQQVGPGPYADVLVLSLKN